MRTPKIIAHPDMKIILRKDFCDKFDPHLKNVMDETGATYFGHNIIKNYREKDHRVSTFCNREMWHELYWEKYRNDDPIDELCHQSSQTTSFMGVSWKIAQNMNSCNKERLKINKIKDGLLFSFKKPDNYFETFLIGWNKLKTRNLDVEYIMHLASLLKPIREYHWKVHNKV